MKILIIEDDDDLRANIAKALKMLEANEARGVRKYIRANCTGMSSVSFSIKLNNMVISGFIHDISSAGLACWFEKDTEILLRKDTVLDDIQLQLKGNLCLLSGTVYGIHNVENESIRYVILFRKIYKDGRDKIHNFIARCLQENIERELDRL